MQGSEAELIKRFSTAIFHGCGGDKARLQSARVNWGVERVMMALRRKSWKSEESYWNGLESNCSLRSSPNTFFMFTKD